MHYLAVFLGAGFGACLRLALSPLNSQLKHAWSWLPLGTLMANVLGGLLAGVILALSQRYALGDTGRLFITTGFLGGLTTFSTFSTEVFTLLIEGRYVLGILLIILHVSLTLLMLAVAFGLVKWLGNY